MSFVDEEFFDEGTGDDAQTPRRRSGGRGGGGSSGGGQGGSPLQRRGVRLGIFAGLIVVVLLVLVTSIRGCQRDQLVDSYRTYVTATNEIGEQSAVIGNELRALLENSKLQSAAQIADETRKLAARADELVVRASDLDPPDALSGPHNTLITALQYRRDALNELPGAIGASNRGGADVPERIATLGTPLQAMAASDIIFMRSFVRPTEAAIEKDDIKDLVVQQSQMFPGTTYNMTAPTGIAQVLANLRRTRPPSGGGSDTDASGRHGLSLVSVVAINGDKRTQLVPGSTANLPASGTTFTVTVENGGDFVETNVDVNMTYTSPTETQGSTQTKTIESISPGADKHQSVTFDQPNPPYLDTPTQIKIEVAAVPNEALLENNTKTYSVRFQSTG